MSSDQTFEFVVCAGCTCLCDDLKVTIRDDQIMESSDCLLAREWLKRLQVSCRCEVDGISVDFETAVARAASLLVDSQSALVCGLDRLSTQSQMLAFKIARELNASIDSTLGTHASRASVLALQRLGNVTASLGEVSTRCDVLVFVNCDPAVTHPRFIERYCKSAKTISVVNEEENATSRLADHFFQIKRDLLGEFLTQLRLGLAGKSVAPGPVQVLLQVIEAAKYGAFVFGELDADPEFNENTEKLFQLVEELNRKSLFVSISLRTDSNALSAENVLTWSTGFPFAISSKGSFFEYNRLEYSSERIIERGECDVVLICSGDSIALTDRAKSNFANIPKIVITDRSDFSGGQSGVIFHVAVDEGDWCRMDDVMLPVFNFLRVPGDKKVRTANDVLTAICNHV